MNTMLNTNKLFDNKHYQDCLKRTKDHEKKRKFCKHNLSHFLDVARIATIKSRESHLDVSKDLIYTTALLHDIGRFLQYEEKIPHEVASYNLALEFLENLDFSIEEKTTILDAVLNHRNPEAKGFSLIFYESDKGSRSCFSCSQEKQCRWAKEKKNLTIRE